MLKAIIFDMDGTLFQTDRILEPSLEDTFTWLRSRNQWNAETPIQKFREIMGVPLPKAWELLLPGHSLESRQAADVYFQTALVNNIHAGRGALYPHAVETLRYFSEHNIAVYIASNGLKAYLQAIVETYRLDRWVTETFSIEQIESLNKADLVKAILKKYAVEAGSAAVVGDRLSDFEAAKANGLLAVGCKFDFARDDELAHAGIVIEDLAELQRLAGPLAVPAE